MNNLLPENQSYIFEIKTILHQARQKVYATIHSEMVWAYWQIGKRIVDEEQQGAERAQYGQQIIQTLSDELTREFGRGFSKRTLWEIRQFYQQFPDFPNMRTVFAQLSWSHFQRVLKVQNEQAWTYYLREAEQNGWSVRTLDRNISTLYYDRLISSQQPEIVQAEMLANTKPLQADDVIKNPTVLEFLNLSSSLAYTEAELEDDNPTIGLLLCTETDGIVAKYSVLHDNPQLFASKYVHYLPSEDELIREIEQQRALLQS